MDVVDDEAVDVELLFTRVVLGVLEEVQQVLSTFLRPPSLRRFPGLALRVASDSAVEPAGRTKRNKLKSHLHRCCKNLVCPTGRFISQGQGKS